MDRDPQPIHVAQRWDGPELPYQTGSEHLPHTQPPPPAAACVFKGTRCVLEDLVKILDTGSDCWAHSGRSSGDQGTGQDEERDRTGR